MKYAIFLFAMAISYSINAQTAEEYLNRGIEKFDRKDDKGAIQDLTKSIELAPTKKAYQIRGLIRCAVNENSGALLDFNKAIELDPRSKDVYSIRGQTRFQLKDYPGALQDLNTAVEYEPQEVENYYYRGRVKHSLKDFKGALTDLNKAIEINSQYQDAYSIRSLVKLELHDFSGASLDLKNADNVKKGLSIQTEGEHKKNQEETLINKGLEKFDHANYTGAISEYNTAISFNPKNEKLYLLRADAWQQLKNYPKSIADYTKAIEIKPQLAEAYNSRGLTKAMALDVNGACEDFRNAVALGDNSSADLIKEFCSSVVKTEAVISKPTAGSVKIGNQEWMTTNLDVSNFRNGDPILEAKTNEEWKKAGEEKRAAWCYLDNDMVNGKKLGKLYNWHAVNDSRGLAPAGWHIPTHQEWTELADYLGSDSVAGTKMQSTSGWMEGQNGNNSSGFTGLPGKYRDGDSGFFGDHDRDAWWWSSTQIDTTTAWLRILGLHKGYLTTLYMVKGSGLSVRCTKD